MREGSLRELEEAFQALSNINRLKLLVQLQSPKGYSEIELTPSRSGASGDEDRPISRQAVRTHVDELLDLGVVAETETPGRKREFVVDRTQLYAIVERMRELATVEPTVDAGGATKEMTQPASAPKPTGPHLALVRGVREGQTFPLEDAAPHDPAVIGRDADSDIALNYDAFVSSQHANVIESDEGFLVQDLEQNKNGTFLNWAKIEPGGVAPLSAGDVIGVGRSLLVFRE